MLPAAMVLILLLVVPAVLWRVRARWFRAAGATGRRKRRQILTALRRETAPDDPALDRAVIAILDRKQAVRGRSKWFLLIVAPLSVVFCVFAAWSGELIGWLGLGGWCVALIEIPISSRRERRRNERVRAAIEARASKRESSAASN